MYICKNIIKKKEKLFNIRTMRSLNKLARPSNDFGAEDVTRPYRIASRLGYNKSLYLIWGEL